MLFSSYTSSSYKCWSWTVAVPVRGLVFHVQTCVLLFLLANTCSEPLSIFLPYFVQCSSLLSMLRPHNIPRSGCACVDMVVSSIPPLVPSMLVHSPVECDCSQASYLRSRKEKASSGFAACLCFSWSRSTASSSGCHSSVTLAIVTCNSTLRAGQGQILHCNQCFLASVSSRSSGLSSLLVSRKIEWDEK